VPAVAQGGASGEGGTGGPHTSSVDEEHEFLAEIPGVGSLLEGLHDQVAAGVSKVLIEGKHHVDKGIRQLILQVVGRRALDRVQQEHHIVYVPLVCRKMR